MTKPVEAVHRQVGAKIESIRTMLGLTQAELATRWGQTRASLANVETGRQRLLLQHVEELAKALGTSPKNLMRGIWS